MDCIVAVAGRAEAGSGTPCSVRWALQLPGPRQHRAKGAAPAAQGSSCPTAHGKRGRSWSSLHWKSRPLLFLSHFHLNADSPRLFFHYQQKQPFIAPSSTHHVIIYIFTMDLQHPDVAMFYTGAHKGDAVQSTSLSLKTCSVLEEFCPGLPHSEPNLQAGAPAPCNGWGRAMHPARAKPEHVAAVAGSAQHGGLQLAPSLQIF